MSTFWGQGGRLEREIERVDLSANYNIYQIPQYQDLNIKKYSDLWEDVHFIKYTPIHIITNNQKSKRFVINYQLMKQEVYNVTKTILCIQKEYSIHLVIFLKRTQISTLTAIHI